MCSSDLGTVNGPTLTTSTQYAMTGGASGNSHYLFLQRLSDNKWLTPLGTWSTAKIAVIYISSNTAITAAGWPLVGFPPNASPYTYTNEVLAGTYLPWAGDCYPTALSPTSVTFGVNAPSGMSGSYTENAQRTQTSGAGSGTVVNTGFTGTSFTDSTIVAGTSYSYVFTATDSASNVATAPAIAITAPAATTETLDNFSAPDGLVLIGGEFGYLSDTGQGLSFCSGSTKAPIVSGGCPYAVGGTATSHGGYVKYSQSLGQDVPFQYSFVHQATATGYYISFLYRVNSSDNGYVLQYQPGSNRFDFGTFTSGAYNTSISSLVTSGFTAGVTYTITGTPFGQGHTFYCQRSTDGYWLNAMGNFQSAVCYFISGTNSTYVQNGAVGFENNCAYNTTNAVQLKQIKAGGAVFLPGNFGASRVAQNFIKLGTQAATGGNGSLTYSLKKLIGGTYTQIATMTPGTDYFDHAVSPSTSYSYRLDITDAGNATQTVSSSVVTYTTPAASTPTVLSPITGTRTHFLTGEIFLDVDGNSCWLHEGCITYDDVLQAYIGIGVNCDFGESDLYWYYSFDTLNWKTLGKALTVANALNFPTGPSGSPAGTATTFAWERIKAFPHPTSGQWVAFAHGIVGGGYGTGTDNFTAIFTCSGPGQTLTPQVLLNDGNYGQNDCDVFLDVDGTAYLYYSRSASYGMLAALASNWMSAASVGNYCWSGGQNEGWGGFERNGMYYLASSPQAGWTPSTCTCSYGLKPWGGFAVPANSAVYTTADALFSPSTAPYPGTYGGDLWSANVPTSANYGKHPAQAYNSQTGHVLKTRAGERQLWGDRWVTPNGTQPAFVVLPYTFNADGSPTMVYQQTYTPTADPVPTAPSSLAIASSSSANTLTWNMPGDGSYTTQVFRGTTTGGESSTPLASGLLASPYVDSTATPGVTYFYTVKNFGNAGLSSASNEVSGAVTGGGVPSINGGLGPNVFASLPQIGSFFVKGLP